MILPCFKDGEMIIRMLKKEQTFLFILNFILNYFTDYFYPCHDLKTTAHQSHVFIEKSAKA